MRARQLLLLVSILASSVLSLAVRANDIEPGKEFYTVIHAPKPIVLDGDLSEWAGVPVLADPKFAVPKYSGTNANPNYVLFEEYDGGTWTGPDDQTSAVQIVYDEQNVYFGFVVTDDYHENSAHSAWNGDSIQLMIANDKRDSQVALYDYGLGGIETDANLNDSNNVVILHEAGPQCIGDGTCLTEAIIYRDTSNKKTFYEIRLPAAAVGLTPPLASGMQFGLGMAINDGDSGTGQAGQKGWGGLGAHAIVFGKTPAETALVTLGSTVSGSDLLFLSAISPTFNAFTFRATDKGASIVDPASAKLTIDGQLVPLTSNPKIVDATDFSYHPTTPFPPNSDHTYLIQIKDSLGDTVTAQGAFKTDNYSLDKLHSYYAQIRSGSSLTPDKGGHTGQAGDTALNFGTGSIITAALVPDASFLNPSASNDVMTVSLWIKKYDNADSSAFWIEAPSSPGNRGFQANVPMSDGNIYFDVAGNIPDDNEIFAPITSFPGYTDDSWWTNLWHHWAFVKNGLATKQIWVDGQVLVEGDLGATPLPTDFSKLWLGSAGGGQGGTLLNMHGLIDDFAIFGTALTTNQIQQLAAGTVPTALPSNTQPLAYWDFSVSAPVVRPTLSLSRSGNSITISWSAAATGFRLRSATSPAGPYSDVSGVTGTSYTINNPAGSIYYRLQQ